MYEAIDIDGGCIVWLFAGPTNTDDDFQRYCDSVRRLDAQAAGRTVAAVVIVDPENPPPSAAWRAEIGRVSKDLVSKPVFALVSRRAIIRGVVTAVNWLTGSKSPFRATSTFADAVVFAERELGRDLPALTRLYEEVRARASSGST